MTATRSEAVLNARSMVGDHGWERLCLKFVRTCFEVDAKYLTAGLAWQNAEIKHVTSDYSEVPRAVPFFWDTSGTSEHVAFTLGKDKEGFRLCASNDIFVPGRIDICRMSVLASRWGAKPLGWSEDLNGVRVWAPRIKNTPNWDQIVEHARKARDASEGQVRRDAQKIIDLARPHSTLH